MQQPQNNEAPALTAISNEGCIEGSLKRSVAQPVDFLAIATDAVRRGFAVIPLAPGDKKPVGFGATSRTRDLNKIRDWATAEPSANVGVCSDEQITILESDDELRLRDVIRGVSQQMFG